MKKWLTSTKGKVITMLMTAMLCIMAALPVFAEGSTGTANSDVTSAFTTVAADMVATGTALIPIALTVVGISLVVVYGIKIFKKIANK